MMTAPELEEEWSVVMTMAVVQAIVAQIPEIVCVPSVMVGSIVLNIHMKNCKRWIDSNTPTNHYLFI